MSFFDDLGKNISSKSQAASAAVKEKTETLKLNNAISAQKARQKDIFTEIGRIYYELHKDDEDIAAELVELFNQVKTIQTEIDSLSDQLSGLKKTVTCPQCGAEIAKGVAFCSNCGNKLAE